MFVGAVTVTRHKAVEAAPKIQVSRHGTWLERDRPCDRVAGQAFTDPQQWRSSVQGRGHYLNVAAVHPAVSRVFSQIWHANCSSKHFSGTAPMPRSMAGEDDLFFGILDAYANVRQSSP